eukprot:TRINITY_DN1005_c0_g1_i1.p1 TRINITY_DN1005_c0_g1~~TRINITY_DN1005_c0_g1_i1.p1  ORF type:complete len:215 (-),score=61.03 TRINITY_DN1005_c0_g1_i1:1101-1700(-)
MRLEVDWEGWEGEEPAFYELAFGSWLSWLCLFYGWRLVEKIVKKVQTPIEVWRLGLVHLLGASFYVVNHYFPNAPFYKYLLYGYAAVFYVLFYFILVHHQMKDILPFVCRLGLVLVPATVYTILFILTENIARSLVTGKVLGRKLPSFMVIPEAILQAISVIATAIVIIKMNGGEGERRDRRETIAQDSKELEALVSTN